MNKIYCPSMWKSIHIDIDGCLTPCCISIDSIDRTHKITDVEDVEQYVITHHEKYRQMMSNGIWPECCKQCKLAEEENRRSKRQDDIANFPELHVAPELVSLEYVQIKAGRTCNLACTICSPSCSTSLADKMLASDELEKRDHTAFVDSAKWADDINQFKKITTTSQLHRIDIAGGEPLLNKTHFEWLDIIKDPSCFLLYNTNGTIRPTVKQIEVWNKFKGIMIAVSIDSYGEKFEKLRVNAKWDSVIENCKFLDTLIKGMPGSSLSFVYTLYAANINDVFETYRQLSSAIGYDISNLMSINYLFYPYDMAIYNMSKVELEKSIQHYETELPKLPKSRLKVDINNILNGLKGNI